MLVLRILLGKKNREVLKVVFFIKINILTIKFQTRSVMCIEMDLDCNSKYILNLINKKSPMIFKDFVCK